METVRYTFRLRPGAQAEAALIAEWHRCRYLWNEAVHQWRSGRKPTFCRLSKMLTVARAASPWLRAGSQVVQQQTLRAYATALTNSFRVKGRGRPRVKRRRDSRPSLEYTRKGFALPAGRLRLVGGVVVPVVWSRDLPSPPSSVRVFQDSLGHWYAAFVVRREVATAPDVTGVIGVDWGVTVTATTTDPAYDLPHSGHRKRCAAELARTQRRMARRIRPRGQAQSKGYITARRQAARLHKKAQRQNTHDARLWAKRVVDNHQTIAVEDFKPRFLARSTMARKAADAAIGTTKRELIERGMRAGREVVLVPAAYTTMTCSDCGTRAKQRIGLNVRIFECATCGFLAGRDLNAARTILATAERNRASADDIRHSDRPLRGGGRSAVRAGNPRGEPLTDTTMPAHCVGHDR